MSDLWGTFAGSFLFVLVVVWWIISAGRTGVSPRWFRGAGDLDGFSSVDRLPFDVLKSLPNPVDNTRVLEADQELPPLRQLALQQRLRNRQQGVLAGLPAFVFDLSWRRGRERGLAMSRHNSSRHYWSVLVVDLGVTSDYVAIKTEGALDKIGKVVGRRDIELGDETFDRRFFVESQPITAAQSLLTPGVRHALLQDDMKSADFYVRDKYLVVAARRPGRQRMMVEGLPPVVSALQSSLPSKR